MENKDEEEICKEQVCNCLYDVLVRGNQTEDCIDYGEDGFSPDNEELKIQGSPEDYINKNHDDEGVEVERLVILSLDKKDSFEIDNDIYTKVLRLMYGSSYIFNTKGLERFGMTIYLVKYKYKHYLNFGNYSIYYEGEQIYTDICPPTIDTIAEAYGIISGINKSLITTLYRLTRAFRDFIWKIRQWKSTQWRFL